MAIFRTYVEHQQAMADLVFLREHKVEANLSQVHESGMQVFSLELEEQDFENARQLLNQEVEEAGTMLNLSDYSLIELREIIIKAHEYSEPFIKLVSAELEKRGEKDLEGLVIEQERHKAELIEEASSGTSLSNTWLIFGYLAAFLGGILGLGMGWFVETGKTNAPDGQTYYSYDERSRKHGKWIKWLGLIFMIFWGIERFFIPMF